MQVGAVTEEEKKLLDRLNDLVLLMDPDYTILEANKAVIQVLGVPGHRILGNRCYEVIHGTVGPPNGCPKVDLTPRGGEKVPPSDSRRPYTVEQFAQSAALLGMRQGK